MMLQEECGTTSISLENAEVIFKEHGIPRRLDLLDDPEEGHTVVAYWSDGFHFRFTGFSWGYREQDLMA